MAKTVEELLGTDNSVSSEKSGIDFNSIPSERFAKLAGASLLRKELNYKLTPVDTEILSKIESIDPENKVALAAYSFKDLFKKNNKLFEEAQKESSDFMKLAKSDTESWEEGDSKLSPIIAHAQSAGDMLLAPFGGTSAVQAGIENIIDLPGKTPRMSRAGVDDITYDTSRDSFEYRKKMLEDKNKISSTSGTVGGLAAGVLSEGPIAVMSNPVGIAATKAVGKYASKLPSAVKKIANLAVPAAVASAETEMVTPDYELEGKDITGAAETGATLGVVIPGAVIGAQKLAKKLLKNRLSMSPEKIGDLNQDRKPVSDEALDDLLRGKEEKTYKMSEGELNKSTGAYDMKPRADMSSTDLLKKYYERWAKLVEVTKDTSTDNDSIVKFTKELFKDIPERTGVNASYTQLRSKIEEDIAEALIKRADIIDEVRQILANTDVTTGEGIDKLRQYLKTAVGGDRIAVLVELAERGKMPPLTSFMKDFELDSSLYAKLTGAQKSQLDNVLDKIDQKLARGSTPIDLGEEFASPMRTGSEKMDVSQKQLIETALKRIKNDYTKEDFKSRLAELDSLGDTTSFDVRNMPITPKVIASTKNRVDIKDILKEGKDRVENATINLLMKDIIVSPAVKDKLVVTTQKLLDKTIGGLTAFKVANALYMGDVVRAFNLIAAAGYSSQASKMILDSLKASGAKESTLFKLAKQLTKLSDAIPEAGNAGVAKAIGVGASEVQDDEDEYINSLKNYSKRIAK